jgi:hypothetical protein
VELDEAITHSRHVSIKCAADNQECAHQHDKLAEWLEELKAYRATGLKPVDVPTGLELANVFAAMQKLKEYESTGLSPTRLGELASADRDGRCVVLPCKIGDTINWLKNSKASTVDGFVCTSSGQWKVHLVDTIPSWIGQQRKHWYVAFSSFIRRRIETEKI